MTGLVKKSEQALKIFFSWQQVLGFFFNNLVTGLKKCPLKTKTAAETQQLFAENTQNLYSY